MNGNCIIIWKEVVAYFSTPRYHFRHTDGSYENTFEDEAKWVRFRSLLTGFVRQQTLNSYTCKVSVNTKSPRDLCPSCCWLIQLATHLQYRLWVVYQRQDERPVVIDAIQGARRTPVNAAFRLKTHCCNLLTEA